MTSQRLLGWRHGIAFLLAGLGPVISGCSSQMDNIDTPITRPQTSAPAGVYEGTLTSVRDNRSRDVIALLDGVDRFIVFSEQGDVVASGVYEKQQSNITWQARRFDRDELDAETVTTLAGEGSYNADSSLQLTFQAADGDFGTLRAEYKPLRYEQRSDLPLLAGTWAVEDEFGFATTSFDISQDGAVFGQDGLDGPRDDYCTYAGRFDLLTQQYNLYQLRLSRQCRGDVSPITTTGLGTLVFDPLSGKPVRIVSASSASAIAVVLSLKKS